MPGRYCGKNAREIDGAAIYSSSDMLYANSACVLRFLSDDSMFTSKRIMINFESFNITDCTATMKIFYDSDTYGHPDVSTKKCGMCITNYCQLVIRVL